VPTGRTRAARNIPAATASSCRHMLYSGHTGVVAR